MSKLTAFLAVLALLFVPVFAFSQDADQADGQQDDQQTEQQDDQLGAEEGGLGEDPASDIGDDDTDDSDVTSFGEIGQPEAEEADDDYALGTEDTETEAAQTPGEAEGDVLGAEAESEGELGAEEPMAEGETGAETDMLGAEQQISINDLIGKQVMGEDGQVVGTIQDVQTDASGNITMVTIREEGMLGAEEPPVQAEPDLGTQPDAGMQPEAEMQPETTVPGADEQQP